jgi:hypothetical protein
MNALGLNFLLAPPSFLLNVTLYSLASRFQVISGGRIASRAFVKASLIDSPHEYRRRWPDLITVSHYT